MILPPPDAIIRPVVEQYLNGMNVPRAPVETVSLALCRALVRTSDAVWFISGGVVADEIEAGVLVSLGISSLARPGPVGLTLRSGQAIPDALNQLMIALREAVAAVA